MQLDTRRLEAPSLLAAMFERAPHGIAMIDLSGRYVCANPAFLRLLGYSERELLQKTIHDVSHPEDKGENRRVFDDMVAGVRDQIEFEKRILRKDGRVIWVRNTVAQVPGEDTVDLAGNGLEGAPEDGKKAVESPLVDPRAIAVDSRGNLYILERSGNAMRVVDPSGAIHTLHKRRGQGRVAAVPGELQAHPGAEETLEGDVIPGDLALTEVRHMVDMQGGRDVWAEQFGEAAALRREFPGRPFRVGEVRAVPAAEQVGS